MNMKVASTMVLLLTAGVLSAQSDVEKRLDAAATVFSEVMQTPDKAVPQGLLDRAQCIVVIPGMKGGAFIFGAKYGKGFLSCRRKSGVGWTAPGSVRIEGGSFGLQIGGTETDVILLVMNERGAQRLLSSQFTLGGDASVAAGPVGRQATAQTDAYMTAEILSWSRSRGVFAGVSLQGSTLRQDSDDNKSLYGKDTDNKDIVAQEVAPPKAAEKLISLFSKYSSRKG
jgi:lipid-binding SYLF domain-containing protein